MPNYLPLPPELQHLIEKRESDERRLAERRQADATENPPQPVGERREAERRQTPPRRQSDRS